MLNYFSTLNSINILVYQLSLISLHYLLILINVFLAKKHGLEEVSPEVVSLISHASQTRLKNLIERLSVIAEHRLDNPKVSTRVTCTCTFIFSLFTIESFLLNI